MTTRIATTVVGSYPVPDWLAANRAKHNQAAVYGYVGRYFFELYISHSVFTLS
jgi:hypothetical protein